MRTRHIRFAIADVSETIRRADRVAFSKGLLMKQFSHTQVWKMLGVVTLGALISSVALSVHAAGTETTAPVNLENADYVAGKKFVEAKDWSSAAAAFERATKAEPNNADAWNMLGYTRRWAGNIQGSFAAYDRALAINPNHMGALNYSGIAHLRNKDLPKAQAQLAKLDALCYKRCDEYKGLADEIAKYQQSGGDVGTASYRSKY
jgi:cytochrome c-type biogenesis protein CcmH/NrfG